jgi:hypothetical protein
LPAVTVAYSVPVQPGGLAVPSCSRCISRMRAAPSRSEVRPVSVASKVYWVRPAAVEFILSFLATSIHMARAGFWVSRNSRS